jgi:hypothetical protein
MRAILKARDMSIFGDATLFGTRINFSGSRFLCKRKVKDPFKVTMNRLKRGVKTNIKLPDGGVVFIEEPLNFGFSYNEIQGMALTASYELLPAEGE